MKFLRNLLLLSSGVVFIPVLLFFTELGYELYAVWIAFFAWIFARGIPLVVKFRKKFLTLANSN